MDLGFILLLIVLTLVYLMIGVMLMTIAGVDLVLWDWYTDETIGAFGLLARLMCWPYVIYAHFNG